MNSLPVPNSDIQLYDGTIVMLQRFPGTKWIVHEGWYSYNGRQYSGWYFCSIPAKTIIPVNQQDLSMLVVVSDNELDPRVPPAPPIPVPPPYPGPAPGPGPWPPGPWPPGPWPPVPPSPEDLPTVFTQGMKARLDAAFISVPSLKHRDALLTEELPDGKIVRVNSVNGETCYYVWNKIEERWDDWTLIKDEIEEALEDYYTSEEIDSQMQDVADSINSLSGDLDVVEDQVETLTQTTDELQGSVAEMSETLSELEDAIYHIQKIAELTGDNTVLVSDSGGIKDSGVSIGDDIIDEPSQFADDKVLATEKAVVKKVEEVTPRWEEF